MPEYASASWDNMWIANHESNESSKKLQKIDLRFCFKKRASLKGSVIKPLLEVLARKCRRPPPVWLMRQAGRYLPEYRTIREKADDFLKLCFTPRLAVEVTLQPVRRFQFDAAILFSDILVVPHALGQRVWFVEGEGPRLEPIADAKGLSRIKPEMDRSALAPIYQTVSTVRAKLSSDIALLGFCGAPWTVASYMVAGRGTPGQEAARLFAYREPDAFGALIDMLVEASAEYLAQQLHAGADAVQIFDTWAGILPEQEFHRWCIEPTRRIVEKLRANIKAAKIIGFPRNAGTSLLHYLEAVPVDAVGLDWSVSLAFARSQIQSRVPVQGNLDPLVLVSGGKALDAAVDHILQAFSDRPFIFNLGHGILPDTPVAHVEQMLARIRR
jgi:uroporphyrinogen decarboxylase